MNRFFGEEGFIHGVCPVERSETDASLVPVRVQTHERVFGGENVAVNFDVPKEIEEAQIRILEKVAKGGKIKIGSNEVTKAIERGNAKLVLIAKDVSPPEIVMHLPVLCKEKNIPFSYLPTKKGLGEHVGLKVGASALAVITEGEAKKELDELSKKLSELQK